MADAALRPDYHSPIEPERFRVPPPPTLLRAIVGAASDLYANSLRLVGANLVWGAGMLFALFVGGRWPPAFLVLGPVEAVLTVGLFRVAALAARGDAVPLGEVFAGWRRWAGAAVATGVVVTVLTLVLLLNVTVGLASRSLVGSALAASAVWGLFVVWAAALAFWPLLVDPRRADLAMRDRLRLTAVLVLASPVRFGLLVLLAGAILALSAVLFAPLLTVSVAFVCLVAARYVLPAADRLERRATELVPE